VSVEAISWALNLAPVPAGRGGQPSSACKFVLVGLATTPDQTARARSHRWPHWSATPGCRSGRYAPAWTGCRPRASSGRATRASLRPGSSAPTAARRGWDLNLSLARHDLDDAAVGILERQFPGLGVRLAVAAQLGADGQADGVQSPHPVAPGGEAVDNSPGGVRQLHPGPGTGCNLRDRIHRCFIFVKAG
jgi:hypothetical protein